MNETLVATTTRPITMRVRTATPTPNAHIETIPTGTEVYVTRIKDDGRCRVRVPGTLLMQDVRLTDLNPA